MIRARCPSPLFPWKCIFLLLLLLVRVLYIYSKKTIGAFQTVRRLSDNLAISQVVLPLFYTFSLVSGRIERGGRERETEEKKYIAAPLESSGGVVFTLVGTALIHSRHRCWSRIYPSSHSLSDQRESDTQRCDTFCPESHTHTHKKKAGASI